MANPASVLNDRNQSIDTLWMPDGTTRIKLGIGSVTSGGLTPDAAWQGVATHEDNASFDASDGVVVGAGVEETGTVVRHLVDAYGRLIVATQPSAFGEGGATGYQLVSAASDNATSVSADASTLYSVVVSNANASARYLKLYDLGSVPTVGTDVPKHTIMVKGGETVVVPFPVGMNFSNGIALALTVEATVAGATGVSANEHVVNLSYAVSV